MNLRRATLSDAEFVLALRNDRATQQMSIHNQAITQDEHVRWLRDSLNSNKREIYIAESNYGYANTLQPVAVGRLDLGLHDAEISLTVAPAYRGHGFGKELIQLLVARAQELRKIPIAKVKPDNTGSLKAFIDAGMRPEGEVVWFRG